MLKPLKFAERDAAVIGPRRFPWIRAYVDQRGSCLANDFLVSGDTDCCLWSFLTWACKRYSSWWQRDGIYNHLFFLNRGMLLPLTFSRLCQLLGSYGVGRILAGGRKSGGGRGLCARWPTHRVRWLVILKRCVPIVIVEIRGGTGPGR